MITVREDDVTQHCPLCEQRARTTEHNSVEGFLDRIRTAIEGERAKTAEAEAEVARLREELEALVADYEVLSCKYEEAIRTENYLREEMKLWHIKNGELREDLEVLVRNVQEAIEEFVEEYGGTKCERTMLGEEGKDG